MAQRFVRITATDPEYDQITALAKRLESLLAGSRATSSKEVQSILDLVLGALYALGLASSEGYEHRPKGKTPQSTPVVDRSAALALGEVRLDGKWMAGFHFNNALFRLSAAFHRTLKVVTQQSGSRAYAGQLLEELRREERAWALRLPTVQLERVHKEVNDWKHTAEGKHGGRDVDLRAALESAEELLRLWEAWPGLAEG